MTAEKIKTVSPVDNHYLQPEWPAPEQVRAFTTVRTPKNNIGFSQKNYASFNLAAHCGDKPEHVQKNRHKLIADHPWRSDPIWLKQIHGSTVIAAHKHLHDIEPEADGVWTNQSNIPCLVMTADCLPVVFCNTQGSKTAVVHAGWRGLSRGILEETVRALNEPADQLLVWLGPAISQAKFQVGSEVREAFININPSASCAFTPDGKDHWHADIYHLARVHLRTVGVHAVYGGNFCTFTESSLFYSYRRDGHQTGRMATVAWIAE